MRKTKAAVARAAAAAAAAAKAEAANSDTEAVPSPGKNERSDRVASEMRIKEVLKDLHQLINQVQVRVR